MDQQKLLRVAISPCPNDTFVFGKWAMGDVPWNGPELLFEYHDIQELNQIGQSEDLPDVLKFSYALWPKLREHYRLSDVGSALGLGVGPLLVGLEGTDVEEIECILVPGFDTTAYRLQELYGPDVRIVEERYDRIMDRCLLERGVAGVIIHESRFTYQERGLACLLDLGQHWEMSTGCPLPLGAVAVHRRLDDTLASAVVQALGASLDSAWLDHSSILPLMKHHAQEMSESVMMEHVNLYVNQYTRHLCGQAHNAIRTLTGCDVECLV